MKPACKKLMAVCLTVCSMACWVAYLTRLPVWLMACWEEFSVTEASWVNLLLHFKPVPDRLEIYYFSALSFLNLSSFFKIIHNFFGFNGQQTLPGRNN